MSTFRWSTITGLRNGLKSKRTNWGQVDLDLDVSALIGAEHLTGLDVDKGED